jgi:hypothetical protein
MSPKTTLLMLGGASLVTLVIAAFKLYMLGLPTVCQ